MTRQAQSAGRESSDLYDKALDAIRAALEEIDDGSSALTGDTVLIGDGGLESLAFVTFAVALEARLQQDGWVVSVFDLASQGASGCTTAQLADRIAAAVG